MNNKDNPSKPDNKPSNPFAFPVADNTGDEPGLTMRDYFAAKAMQALVSNTQMLSVISNNCKEDNIDIKDGISKRAYNIADAMLKERSSHE